MTDKHIELSRRQILGSLGTIGVASAGAGLGTSAFFSDEETFARNDLVAGSLDLKVDWEEHYSDWSSDEDIDGVTMNETTGELEFANQSVQSEFMNATLLERVPNETNRNATHFGELDPCEVLPDPDNLDRPLINIEDVKPGDTGEVTFSLHPCGNPGYLWMNGRLRENAENGLTEPEADDPDENGGEPGELADLIRARLFYDGDGDNVLDEDKPCDVMLVFDRSNSMEGEKFQNAKAGAKVLVDALGANDQVGLVSFADEATKDVDLLPATSSNKTTVKNALDNLTLEFETRMEDGVLCAHEELTGVDNLIDACEPSGNDRDVECKVMVFLTNGKPFPDGQDPSQEATAAKDAGIEIFTIAFGSDANVGLLNDMASQPKDQHAFLSGEIDQVVQVFAQIGIAIAGEKPFMEGTLAEILERLSSGPGIPLDGNPVTDARDCYENSLTQYIGFEWELPIDHGNEVQTDSVTFDLGFYTEQCRHNDGSGICPCGEDEYAVEVGNEIFCITPIERDQSIEEFYNWAEEKTQVNGPARELAESDTSVLFLYRNTGSDELSLVMIHDIPEDELGGAVTFDFAFGGIAPQSWDVQDDHPSINPPDEYHYTASGVIDQADWSWKEEFTDGGAIPVDADPFKIQVDPAFNDDAVLDPQDTGGQSGITSWKALSGDGAEVELPLDEGITVYPCDGQRLPIDAGV